VFEQAMENGDYVGGFFSSGYAPAGAAGPAADHIPIQ
jgi:hypothetical protein